MGFARSVSLAALLAAGSLNGYGSQHPHSDDRGQSPAAAEAERARVRELILFLGHPSYREREAAQAALLALPACWREFLSEELGRAEDAEVQARLSEILGQVGRLRWRQDLSRALAEAGRLQKPLFVFCSQTAAEDWDQSPNLFHDPALVDYVNEHFLPVWHPSGVFLAPAGAGGPFSDAALFCRADGTVRHAFSGPWIPEAFLKQARQAAEVFCRIENPEVAAIERRAFEAKLEAEASRIEASLPALESQAARAARARLESLRALAQACRSTRSIIGKPVFSISSGAPDVPPAMRLPIR